MTEKQIRAMGPEGTKCLWDYWYGKVLAAIALVFIVFVSALGFKALW